MNLFRNIHIPQSTSVASQTALRTYSLDHMENAAGVDDYQNLGINQVETRSKKRARMEEEKDTDIVPEPAAAPVVDRRRDLAKCHCNLNLSDKLLKCIRCGLGTHLTCIGWLNTVDAFQCKSCMDLMINPGAVDSKQEQQLLKKAHLSHPGIHGMRILLKNYKWPGRGKDIISKVTQCRYCKQKMPPKMSDLQLRLPKYVSHYCGLDLMSINDDQIDYRYLVCV
eukprot:NODE_189_length_13483_cov_0.581067.p5 type:complete len:224 gc:universal NODE_189_length_13483_cov_0.581067:4725-5396(+)